MRRRMAGLSVEPLEPASTTAALMRHVPQLGVDRGATYEMRNRHWDTADMGA